MLKKAEDWNPKRFWLLDNCLTILYNPYKPAFQKHQNPVHNNTQKTQEGQQNQYIFRGKTKLWQPLPLTAHKGALVQTKPGATRGTGSSMDSPRTLLPIQGGILLLPSDKHV